jgi:hypothetical protein
MNGCARVGLSALLTGAVASVVSTAALALLAKADSTNATSHWLHGDEAARHDEGKLVVSKKSMAATYGAMALGLAAGALVARTRHRDWTSPIRRGNSIRRGSQVSFSDLRVDHCNAHTGTISDKRG